MEKKLYTSPLVEAEELRFGGVLLASPQGDDTPLPPMDPGYTPIRRRTPVF